MTLRVAATFPSAKQDPSIPCNRRYDALVCVRVLAARLIALLRADYTSTHASLYTYHTLIALGWLDLREVRHGRGSQGISVLELSPVISNSIPIEGLQIHCPAWLFGE